MIWRKDIHKVVLRLPDSWSNWNLEVLFFEKRVKPEFPEKNFSEQGRKPTTNSTHIWRQHRDLNPGHIGGKWALSALCHPCSQMIGNLKMLSNEKRGKPAASWSKKQYITQPMWSWLWDLSPCHTGEWWVLPAMHHPYLPDVMILIF